MTDLPASRRQPDYGLDSGVRTPFSLRPRIRDQHLIKIVVVDLPRALHSNDPEVTLKLRKMAATPHQTTIEQIGRLCEPEWQVAQTAGADRSGMHGNLTGPQSFLENARSIRSILVVDTEALPQRTFRHPIPHHMHDANRTEAMQVQRLTP